MAIEVRVPKEITEYQERIIGSLSIRQLGVVVLSIAVSIGTGFLFTNILDITMENASWVIILLNIPILCFGWFKRHTLTFEKYVKIFLKYHLSSGIRIYRTEK